MSLHPLDNHLWNALNGPLARYSRAVGRVRMLTPEIGSVCAIEDDSPANLSDLAAALSVGAEVLVIAPQPLRATAELELLAIKPVLQMVAELPETAGLGVPTMRLGPDDLPQMRALVDVARPGPLGSRALELGNFYGVFESGKLVAMAGERLRLDRYVEVASVCTHPGYRGKGYAKAVVSALMQDIVGAGFIPFLGVDDGNTPAIRLYENLGFKYRTTFYLSFLRRARG